MVHAKQRCAERRPASRPTLERQNHARTDAQRDTVCWDNDSIAQRVSRYIATTRYSAAHHGYAAALFQMLLRMVNKLFSVQVLRCVLIAELNPAALIVDSR